LHDWSRELLLGNGLNQWFEQNTISALLTEHRTARMDHGKRLYALTMLALWAKSLS